VDTEYEAVRIKRGPARTPPGGADSSLTGLKTEAESQRRVKCGEGARHHEEEGANERVEEDETLGDRIGGRKCREDSA